MITAEQQKILDRLTKEQKKALENDLMAMSARNFDADGFSDYFQLVFGMPLLPHMRKVIDATFKAYENHRGIAIELFRGAAKTTTVTIGFTSYLIGHFPTKSFLFVQGNDAAATKNCEQIARVIEYYPGWKKVFPHVVPDKTAGWSQSGYEVMCTHTDATLSEELEYSDWQKMNSKRNDESFLGIGYKSASIIGRRPFGLILDDLNNRDNVESEREGRRLRDILTETIFPAANQSQFNMEISTPWHESDVLHYCLSTGRFDHIRIPIYTDGKPTWAAMYDEARIAHERDMAGEIGFARMYLLDLSKTKGLILKKDWLEPYFDAAYINQDWPVYIGVDYTSTADPRKEKGDYFCIAVMRLMPNGKLVLEDGLRTRVSQAEAFDAVIAWVSRYPTLADVRVEAIITGNEFYNSLLDNAALKEAGIFPSPGRTKKSKGYRFEKLMAPKFQRSQVLISNGESSFLNSFKDEWMNWQGDPLEKEYHNDTLDAVFWAIEAANLFVSNDPRTVNRGANPWAKTNTSHKTTARRAWARSSNG